MATLHPQHPSDSSPRSRFFYLLLDPFPFLWAWPRPRVTSPASPPPRPPTGGGAGPTPLQMADSLSWVSGDFTPSDAGGWSGGWASGAEVNRWMINKVTASAGVVCWVRTTTRRSRDVSLVCFFCFFWGLPLRLVIYWSIGEMEEKMLVFFFHLNISSALTFHSLETCTST